MHLEVLSTKLAMLVRPQNFNTLRQRQNGHYFTVDILKCIFFNENDWISIRILLKFVPKFLIDSIPALVQIMAWRLTGDKPLSEPMVVSLLTHMRHSASMSGEATIFMENLV